MSGARKLAVAPGPGTTTAALAAAFVTASSRLDLLAAIAGLSTRLAWQLRDVA